MSFIITYLLIIMKSLTNIFPFISTFQYPYLLNLINSSLYFYFSLSVPETWTRYTEENIRRALSEIAQSDELLNAGNQLMAQSNNDMWSQWNHVNISLENRVQEGQVAKNKIQAHLEKVSFSKLQVYIFIFILFHLGSSRDLRC